MADIAAIQKILAYQGLAAAQAAAAGTTDPAILHLFAHYTAGHCSPTTAPIPATSGPRSVSPGSFWYYNPGGQDICSFSLWDPSYGAEPAPPDPDTSPLPAAPAPVVAAPVAPIPALPIPSGQNVVSATPSFVTSAEAWLTEPSFISSSVPNYWLLGGAVVLGLLLFGHRR